jgi:Arc/MetJ-type ribon-helix-helix transcriptional regulator
MQQAKFSLDDAQIAFIEQFKSLGFKDKSELIREAISQYQTRVEQKKIAESAALYATLYLEDEELQELTEAAIAEWPE